MICTFRVVDEFGLACGFQKTGNRPHDVLRMVRCFRAENAGEKGGISDNWEKGVGISDNCMWFKEG